MTFHEILQNRRPERPEPNKSDLYFIFNGFPEIQIIWLRNFQIFTIHYVTSKSLVKRPINMKESNKLSYENIFQINDLQKCV